MRHLTPLLTNLHPVKTVDTFTFLVSANLGHLGEKLCK